MIVRLLCRIGFHDWRITQMPRNKITIWRCADCHNEKVVYW